MLKPPRRRQIVAAVMFIVLLVFLLTEFRLASVHGDSMLPTYKDGQLVLVNRLPGYSSRLSRGDVVLVRANNDILIKRVYRLPGETISRAEAWRFGGVKEYFEPTHNLDVPLRVPNGFIVVLGDNAAVSDDSRNFGPVALTEIVGKVMNAPPGPTR